MVNIGSIAKFTNLPTNCFYKNEWIGYKIPKCVYLKWSPNDF